MIRGDSWFTLNHLITQLLHHLWEATQANVSSHLIMKRKEKKKATLSHTRTGQVANYNGQAKVPKQPTENREPCLFVSLQSGVSKTERNKRYYNRKLHNAEFFCGLLFSRGGCFYSRRLQEGLRAWLRPGKFGICVYKDCGSSWSGIPETGEGRGDWSGTCGRRQGLGHGCRP